MLPVSELTLTDIKRSKVPLVAISRPERRVVIGRNDRRRIDCDLIFSGLLKRCLRAAHAPSPLCETPEMRAATTGLLALSATFAGCAALGPAPISPTPSILVDLDPASVDRTVIVESITADRNGLLYLPDRVSGNILRIDPKSPKPVVVARIEPRQVNGQTVAANGGSLAFNAQGDLLIAASAFNEVVRVHAADLDPPSLASPAPLPPAPKAPTGWPSTAPAPCTCPVAPMAPCTACPPPAARRSRRRRSSASRARCPTAVRSRPSSPTGWPSTRAARCS